MWLASSRNGGGSWSGANQIGPYLYGYHSSHAPYVAARGDMVIATWYTAPNPTEMVDTDAVAAVSSDRGRTFDLRTIGGGAGQQLSPVVAPWGPDPLGAGFAYWMLDENWYQRRHAREVRADERRAAGRRGARRASRSRWRPTPRGWPPAARRRSARWCARWRRCGPRCG